MPRDPKLDIKAIGNARNVVLKLRNCPFSRQQDGPSIAEIVSVKTKATVNIEFSLI
jgi:hypothetical protein